MSGPFSNLHILFEQPSPDKVIDVVNSTNGLLTDVLISDLAASLHVDCPYLDHNTWSMYACPICMRSFVVTFNFRNVQPICDDIMRINTRPVGKLCDA